MLYPNQCVNTNDLTGALAFAQAAVNNFAAACYGMLRDACTNDAVIGALVCLQLPDLNYRHQDGPQLGSVVRWLVTTFYEPGDARLTWILKFAGRYELGMFGPRSLAGNPAG